LYYLEDVIVGDNKLFEEFLNAYVTKFAFQSITSNDMKQFFIQHFTGIVDQKKLDSIEWDKWLTTTGDVYRKNNFSNKLAPLVTALANKLIDSSGQAAQLDDLKGWSSQQICFLLDEITNTQKSLDSKIVTQLDAVYKLTQVKNDEIRFRWQMLALKHQVKSLYSEVVKFLSEMGRGKYVYPLYQSLNDADHQLAVSTYEANKVFYHPLVAKNVAKELNMQK
jgi:hypothetical protein